MTGSLNSGFLSRSALEALGFKKLGTDVLIHSTAVIVDCGRISLGSRIRIDPYVIISTQGEVEFGDNIHVSANAVLAGHAGVPARRLAERPRNALAGEREYLASMKKSD